AQEAIDVDVVERGLDLIEDVEGTRPRHQHREHEGQRDQRLLAAREEREPAGRLARGSHLDLDAAVLVRGRELLGLFVLSLLMLWLLTREGPGRAADVDAAQPAAASR